MDTSLPALMARIREIQSRMQELQGMASRGISPAADRGNTSSQGPEGPDTAVPPAAPAAEAGGTEASDGATAGGDFSALLEEALGVLGRDSGVTGTEDVRGAVDLMSSALSSLSSLTDSGEDGDSDFLMSRDNLSRLTDLERVLRGRLDDSTLGE